MPVLKCAADMMFFNKLYCMQTKAVRFLTDNERSQTIAVACYIQISNQSLTINVPRKQFKISPRKTSTSMVRPGHTRGIPVYSYMTTIMLTSTPVNLTLSLKCINCRQKALLSWEPKRRSLTSYSSG